MIINKPTLLVSERVVRSNIRHMLGKIQPFATSLRPHFKTHHSRDIGEWYRDEGITKITCSSVTMAQYFAQSGWKDITVAFPYNPLEADDINDLAGKITLNVLIESVEALEHLISRVEQPLTYFIKIDIGTHRTGVSPDNIELIMQLANKGSQHRFKGLLAHAGHAYQQLDKDRAQEIFDQSIQTLTMIKSVLNLPELIISYGDTPTCTLVENLKGVDEIRPGNFAFYDRMQASFGVCTLDHIGVCLVCPVVAIHAERNEAVIYGGGVHLSKDFIIDKGVRNYGTVVDWNGDQWSSKPRAFLSKLSQEHGIINGSRDYIDSLKVGDLIGVLPIHSCLTADLQGSYLDLQGNRLHKLNRTP